MSTPGIDAEILTALYQHCDDWAAPSGMLKIFAVEKANPNGAPYVRFANMPNTKERITIGNGGIHSMPGILQASFVYQLPSDYSEPQMLQHMGTLVTHFKSGTVLTTASDKAIRITSEPSLGGQQISADRFQMSVSINWRIFD